MKRAVVLALALGLVGCHVFTRIKPDFSRLPEAAMREVALEIETAIQEGEREPAIADRDGIVVGTDVIQQAIKQRAARRDLLNAFLDTGHAYEAANGLVMILRTREYKKAGTRGDRDRNALLVMNENADRWAIFEGFVDSSNLSSRACSAIQDIFHEARVAVMKAGQKYESESGEVMEK